MNRMFIFFLTTLLLVSLLGCSAQQEIHGCEKPCALCGLCMDGSCQEEACSEKCQGHHSCSQVCPDCGKCLNESCREGICAEKCPGHHVCNVLCPECGLCGNPGCAEKVCAEKCAGHKTAVGGFYTGDFITAEQCCIDTGTLVLDIDPGIWVPGHARDASMAVAEAIEAVSGLSFAGNGYSRSFPDGKIHAGFSRDLLYTGQDWFQGRENSEVGGAYASSITHAMLSPGDLYLSGGAAMIHELSHILSYRQTEWTCCQLLTEGFAEYTNYLSCLYLQEHYPQLGFYLADPRQSMLDMYIYDYRQLYAYPVEYWFENTFEQSGNANYPIGFRFMAYLRDVYGDYSSWILKMEELHNFQNKPDLTDVPAVEWQIEALKAAYGDDVLENFYPWLKAHERDFSMPNMEEHRDLTGLEQLNLYPWFTAIFSDTKLQWFAYEDLYINLEPAKAYLSLYKNLDISGLTLSVSAPTRMVVYDAEGNGTEILLKESMSAEGISFIHLPGKGKLDFLKLTGYEGCE